MHIRIAMRDVLYEKILPTIYNIPVDPGGTAQVPVQATIAVRLRLQDEHAEAYSIHKNNQNMDTSLKNIIFKAVDSTYIFTPHKFFTVCMGLSTKDIMNHLMARYRQIAVADTNRRKILQ